MAVTIPEIPFVGQMIVAVVFIFVMYRRLYDPLKHIPKATDLNYATQVRNFLREPRGPDLFGYALRTPNNGILRYSGMLGGQRILVTSPDAMREVLQEKSYKFQKTGMFRRLAEPVIGNGLFLSEGDVHRVQRRNLNPAFATRHIRDLYPIFKSKADELVTAISSFVTNGENKSALINITNWSSRAALDMIGIATFGQDFGTLQNPDSDVSKAYRRLFAVRGRVRKSIVRGVLALILPAMVVRSLPDPEKDEIEAANKIIRAFCWHAIEEAKKKAVSPDTTPGVDILSIAAQSNVFTDEDLADQLMTFLIAGHETSALSLSWTVYLLCKHRDVQARLRKEIQGAFTALSTEKRAEMSLLDLPYLRAVTEESLRVMPPVPMVTRQNIETLSIRGQRIPTRTFFTVSPWIINRSPQIWGLDSTEFDPERWMATKGGAAKASDSLTFLHGSRACIGQGFAKAELAALLAGLVASFDLKLNVPEKDAEMEFGFLTLRPRGGLMVRMEKVNGA